MAVLLVDLKVDKMAVQLVDLKVDKMAVQLVAWTVASKVGN